MYITNLLVAGGVAYAGVKTVVGSRAPTKATSTGATATGSTLIQAAPIDITTGATDDPIRLTLAERRQLAVAATSFWLAIGGLIWTPLTIASIPLTLYSTVPVLEAGCRSLYAEGRLKPSVVNSILLVSTLVTDHYLPAAVIVWLHHTFRQLGRRAQVVSEQVTTEVNNELGDLLRQATGGAPRTVWVMKYTVAEGGMANESSSVEVKVPFSDVKLGDIIVVNRGEFIPVEGVVTAGAAKVNLFLLTRSPTPVEVGVGDKVYTATFVVEGRLQVQVGKLPEQRGGI